MEDVGALIELGARSDKRTMVPPGGIDSRDGKGHWVSWGRISPCPASVCYAVAGLGRRPPLLMKLLRTRFALFTETLNALKEVGRLRGTDDPYSYMDTRDQEQAQLDIDSIIRARRTLISRPNIPRAVTS